MKQSHKSRGSRGSSPTVTEGSPSNPSALPKSRSTAPVAPAQITLLTDFGTTDYYVAAVKGVILSINPSATIVDITHQIPPQNIEAAAFTLLTCYRSFAVGTIHLAVVDPGVGSSRRAILVNAGGYFFVGPDNGIFSYVLDNEYDSRVFHVTAEKYFRQPLSSTFHGRDVFAPVVAALSTGVPPEAFGPKIQNEVRMAPLKPVLLKDGRAHGRIIHIDRFGNCVTNFDRDAFSKANSENLSLKVNGKEIKSLRELYSEGKADKNLFAIWGSAGFLEISVQNRSAAKILMAKCGDLVSLKIGRTSSVSP
ncbi:MAG TPA: SAM-dependent chlorinase/fluorinase [Pyrinomonadaceae bacterium]|nr:SAM-dependent chlorinase/fluorinase [Pyrinomonadaceae bacterium]